MLSILTVSSSYFSLYSAASISAFSLENQRERENLTLIKNQYDQEEAELARLRQQLAEYESRHQQTAQNLEIAQKSALDLQDE